MNVLDINSVYFSLRHTMAENIRILTPPSQADEFDANEHFFGLHPHTVWDHLNNEASFITFEYILLGFLFFLLVVLCCVCRKAIK